MTEMKPILLAEDRLEEQLLVKRAFRKKHIPNPLVIADDGVEAIEVLFGCGQYVEKGPLEPALVLLDLKMPKIDGLEVLRRLRSVPVTATLPIIMLTSSDAEADLVKSYNLGANSYVCKPIEFNAFADSIAKICTYWLMINKVPA